MKKDMRKMYVQSLCICCLQTWCIFSHVVCLAMCESTLGHNKQVLNGGRLTLEGHSESEWMTSEQRGGQIELMS